MNDMIESLNIFNLEFQLNEKLDELSCKTEALQEVQKELSQIQQQFNEQQMLLEDNRRSLKETKMQLQSTLEITKMLEKENMKNHSERLQVQINYESVLRERDSLLEQARNTKIENMQLKREIRDLEDVKTEYKDKYKTFEQSFTKLRNEIIQTSSDLHSNVIKLSKEHDYLGKSVETVTEFNKRLQTVGLCMHAIYRKQEIQIQNLKCKLALVTSSNTFPDIQNITDYSDCCESQLDPQMIMSELRSEYEKMEDFEKQFNNFLDELQGLSNERHET